MPYRGESNIEALVRFARLASEARTRAAFLPILADALTTQLGAGAVAILEIMESGEGHFVASKHLPPEVATMAIDPDEMEHAPQRILKACPGFAHVESRPLVSGGGLFGMVVMLFAKAPKPERLADAEGLIDLAAIAIEGEARFQQLLRTNAELQASQEALARTEKLRALGQMAAGVSHDLKNMLSPMSLHLQLVSRAADRKDFEEVKQSAAEMKMLSTRGVQTVERLRDYSRQSPESRAAQMDLNALAHEAAEIARPRMSSRKGALGRIKEELGTPSLVLGRSGEIVSALVNLVVNAIDAIDAKGTITVRTGESKAGSWVSVSDDGAGMSPEIQKRVFEPFFTTKGDEGTGLGLAMVYASMQRHGGNVTLDTVEGKGTTFTLTFPRA